MVRWEDELAELVVRRGGALVGYAYSLTRDKTQAEDLVQDALVKIYSRLRRPTPAGGQTQLDLDRPDATNAEGYVRRAILTIYLDGYRRRNHWAGLKHLLADDDSAPGADRVATARVDVGTALRQLSPRQREVVLMRFFDDLTVPQIAAALGTSQGTVKRHLFDATAVLRQALAEVSVPAVETALDERLDVVAGAVRRRRAAKVGAVAGVSMVLAVALAWGAFAVRPLLRSEPLPADDKVEYTPGYVPANWSRDAGVYCGMPVDELRALDTGVFDVEITGELAPVAEGTGAHWELPVTISGSVPDSVTEENRGYFISSPLIVWAHEGRVVDLGAGWREADPDVSLALSDHGTWSGAAVAGGSTSCLEDTLVPGSLGDYQNERPGAEYELLVVLSYEGLLLSDPVTVDLDSGVAPAPTFAAPSGDCSGAAYQDRTVTAQDIPERIQGLAEHLLTAVTTCDGEQVAELGQALRTLPGAQPVSPSVNEVFALPEADGHASYAMVARLLSETRPVSDASGVSWTWPRVSRSVDDDAAWQQAIDAGAIIEEQAAADRAEGIYTGWRLELEDFGEPSPVTWGSFYQGGDRS
ncbi:RNA polymerase sigma factor [Promicromonospora sukumoe]|uniref:RNA polymerase sigma factor n=1 Tax=Promicromonospora sukumoe TaxID=88382 RepID=UPI00365B7E21